MKSNSFIVVLILILLTACSHTNKLAEYELRSKNYAFRNNLSSNAQQMTVTIKSSTKDTTDLAETISSIFTDVVSESKKRELVNAVDTHNLIDNISYGVSDALETYLSANIIEEDDGSVDFLVENSLRKCDLNISQSAVKIYVSSATRIIDLTTATVIWDNTESKSIPMSSILSVDNDQINTQSEEYIFILQKLFSLSEEELNQKMGLAGEYVGKEMGETLRRDIAESHRKD
ncbi:MAG: hypothetical protein JSW63_01690 [Ignavibacterium sp.]|nr:MAG: hypothetical protein JSW63_01690 [Ignavibacterium sp.]